MNYLNLLKKTPQKMKINPKKYFSRPVRPPPKKKNKNTRKKQKNRTIGTCRLVSRSGIRFVPKIRWEARRMTCCSSCLEAGHVNSAATYLPKPNSKSIIYYIEIKCLNMLCFCKKTCWRRNGIRISAIPGPPLTVVVFWTSGCSSWSKNIDGKCF